MAEKDQIATMDLLRSILDLQLIISLDAMREVLYCLSILNIEYDYIFTGLILEYHHKMLARLAPQPTYEVTLGNKNVAETGGVQMNGNWSQDPNKGIMDLLKDIIRADHGK